MPGYTLIELLLVASLTMTLLATALPPLGRAAADGRTRAAGFYVASRVALLRARAVRGSANVALRFDEVEGRWQFREYADGDGDGVRAADIASARDSPVGDGEALEDRFRGVVFGFVPGCPLIDGSPVADDTVPIRVGSARMLSFSPGGTATSGTLYVRGSGPTGYAVVVLGVTGRTRLLRCRAWSGAWALDGR